MVDYEIIFTVKTDLLEKFFFGAQVKEQVKFSRKKNLKNFGKFRKIFKKFFFEKKIPNLVLQKDFAWVVQIERGWAQNDRKKKTHRRLGQFFYFRHQVALESNFFKKPRIYTENAWVVLRRRA